MRAFESVEFQIADLAAADLPAADVVTANLTGAVLIRSAARLLELTRPGGTLIVSGLLEEERDDVVRAFAGPIARAGPFGPATALGTTRRRLGGAGDEKIMTRRRIDPIFAVIGL